MNTRTELGALLLRGLALFFVFFTLVDIAALCGDEYLPSSPGGVVEAASAPADERAVTAGDADDPSRDHERDSDPDAGCEDCCFACARVLSGAHFSVPHAQDRKLSHAATGYVYKPSPTLSGTYHPPRSA